LASRTYQVLDALPHFSCGLIGECDGEDLGGPNLFRVQHVSDAMSQHPGLTASGTGHNQKRTATVHHGGSLLWIQPLKQGIRV
jgi:hypothetical protein